MMNVELAIRRELAYRRKVFLLQSQPDDDLEKDQILPLQVQSSSINISPSRSPCPSRSPSPSQTPRLSGMKRQTRTSSAEFPSPQLSQPFYSISNTMHANQADNILCTICHVPCSGAYSYKQHINGRKHKFKLQELKFDRNIVCQDGKVAKKQRWCQVCKVWCMDEILFKMHLNGKSTRVNYKRQNLVGILVERLQSSKNGVNYVIFGAQMKMHSRCTLMVNFMSFDSMTMRRKEGPKIWEAAVERPDLKEWEWMMLSWSGN